MMNANFDRGKSQDPVLKSPYRNLLCKSSLFSQPINILHQIIHLKVRIKLGNLKIIQVQL